MTASKEYGRRLIPNIVDERAQSDPERAVYSIPISREDLSRGFEDISARVFANAVNRIAWWLESELGKGSSFQTVGYIGPHDIRYVLLVLGCIKAGYKTLLTSPRNSIEASLAVLAASDCNIWVLPSEQPKFLPELLDLRPMKVLNIAEVEDILRAEPVPHYAYDKTFEEASNEPFCVLHTSGSTGHPKPIIWKHSLLATLDASRLLPEHSARPPWVVIFEERDRFYSAFPFFHAAGAIMNILINPFYGTCNVLGPVGVPSSVELIDSLLDYGNIKVWSIIPSIVDEIGEIPAVHTKFKNSKIIIASGGPVTYASANKATESVRVMNLTGTSEGLFMGSLLTESEDWIYFSFHPYVNFDFREIEPGVYEHYVVRDEQHVAQFQGYFHTFPNVKEITLKDLYTAHPTKPGLWLYKGRTDDLVVLSNSEKIHPTDMEAIINRHPAISASLIVGTGKFQASLLAELRHPEPDSIKERMALRDSIYEQVQVANSSAPSHARILKENILFAKPEKPFARTDKNTLKRRMTVILYETEIEAFYKELESGDSTSFDTRIDVSSSETTTQGVRDVLIASLPSIKALGPDDDLFFAGFDSILAFRVVRCLRSAAEKYGISEEKKSIFVPQLVYANPTLNQLSNAFSSLLHKTEDSPNNLVQIQTQNMKDYYTRYTANLPNSARKRRDRIQRDGDTVILTGSTGSLGSYLLDSLVRRDNVKKIYCLNRAEDGMKIQKEVSQPRGLLTAWPAGRIQFLKVDLSKSKFGLDQNLYNELLSQTTHIIHNQWPVNFNYGISSFEPHIQGVRKLVDFCIESELAPVLFFVSTISTVSHLKGNGVVPEAPTDVLTTEYGGYGSSKQVSELILRDASEKAGVDVAICRVGQIAGPTMHGEQGMWAKQEWIPTIIASSKYLGVLPSTLGSMDRVDWIPVDILANIIVELAGATKEQSSINGVDKYLSNGTNEFDDEPSAAEVPVYHAVNPEESEWADLVSTVHDYLGKSVKVVTWGEWVDALSKSQHNQSAANLKQNPGLKLLKFFETLQKEAELGQSSPVLKTERAQTKSGNLAALKPVDEQWMEMWLKQWNF
ncbi:MAG: Transmembrane osmosensor [Chaenotheca gracillima]|nr:MAG: Transmembrane osmosensor [Chaenotheca gracillima]